MQKISSDLIRPFLPLLFLSGISVAVLIISNIASVKLASLGVLTFDAGTILFPLAYVISDIITEIYGLKTARKVILIGFIGLFIMSATLTAVQYLPAVSGAEFQTAYETILGFAPRIALASLVAYGVGILVDITVFQRMKEMTKGKGLWQRIITSSAIGQFIDTVIFSTIAFAGTIPGTELVTLIFTVYILKLVFELIFSPLTVKAIHYIRKNYDTDSILAAK